MTRYYGNQHVTFSTVVGKWTIEYTRGERNVGGAGRYLTFREWVAENNHTMATVRASSLAELRRRMGSLD